MTIISKLKNYLGILYMVEVRIRVCLLLLLLLLLFFLFFFFCFVFFFCFLFFCCCCFLFFLLFLLLLLLLLVLPFSIIRPSLWLLKIVIKEILLFRVLSPFQALPGLFFFNIPGLYFRVMSPKDADGIVSGAVRSESALFFQAFLSKDVESLLFSFKSNKQNGNVLVFCFLEAG